MSASTPAREKIAVAQFSVNARRRTFDWTAAAICFVVLSVVAICTTWPPLPRVLQLQITLPPGEPGHSEPLLTTGEFGNGDLLVAKYEARDRVVFAYDAWGVGGPNSAPIPYEPGSVHRLEVEMPALAELPGVSTRTSGLFRLVFDGQTLIAKDVSFHRRQARQIYFGQNQIGGNTGAVFRGKLLSPKGNVLIGGPGAYFSVAARIWCFFSSATPLAGVVLLSTIFGLLVPLALGWMNANRTRADSVPNIQPPHRWFYATSTIALLCFIYVITDGTFRLIYPESFGTFYDFQALSLLHGHLDVPEEALSGEAFMYAGKCFGYFGPTPALMRIPLALINLGFGKLSRLFMTLDYAACLGAVYFLLCYATRMRRGPTAWPSRWSTVVFVGSAGLGSTIFYLASRAYIYHEAIICGVAFTLWAGYFTLRYLEAPSSRWWIGALICGTLAVHARPPTGLYALALIGIAGAINLVRHWVNRGRGTTKPPGTATAPCVTHLAVGALAVGGVLSFNGLSYLKFHTIEGCPLRYNVQYNPTRLARIEGKQFHLSNLHFGFDAYLARPTLQISRHFPYFATHGLDSRFYSTAKLDLTEEMAGLPWAMPALFLLTVASIAVWWQPNAVLRWQWLAAWAAVIPPAVAMFAAIAVAHRYTADFVGFLIVAGALGMAAIDGGHGLGATLRRIVLVVLALLSMAITSALTIRYQGEGVWGVPDETQHRFKAMRARVDQFFHVKP